MKKKNKIRFSFTVIIAVLAIVAIISEIISNVSADEDAPATYTKYSNNILGVPGDFCVFCYGDASVSEVTADIAIGGDFSRGAFGNYMTDWNFYDTYDLRHVNLHSYIAGTYSSNTFYNWQASKTKEELTTSDGTVKGSYDVENKNGKGIVYLNKNNNEFSTNANQTTVNGHSYDNPVHQDQGSDVQYHSYDVIGVEDGFIDFDQEFENLQAASERLMNQPNQPELDCIPTDGSQTYTYTFPSDKNVMVVKVDPNTFFNSNIVNIFNIDNFESGKKIVINVDCTDLMENAQEGTRPPTPIISVNGSRADWNVLAEDIVFNFYSENLVTNKSLETKEIIGTILAPNLNVYVNGNLDGAVIARKVTSQEAIHGINLNISWDDIEGEPEKITIPVTKSWDDNNDENGNRPDSVTFYIKKGNETVDTITLSGPDWTGTSSELPKEDDNGEEIAYSVDENVPSGYLRESTTGNQTDGFIITNKPETVVLHASKTWSDDNDRDGIRPNKVTFNIYDKSNPSQSVGTIEVTKQENGKWTGESSALPKYKNKQIIEYEVKEDNVPDGYRIGPSASGSSDVYAINNVHDPETIKINVEKIWNDNDNQDGVRPNSIDVGVFKGEEKVDTITLTGPNWTGSSKLLYKNENGSAIAYTVRELKQIPGYTIGSPSGSVAEGFKIENTYTTETVTLDVKKEWDDNNNQDGIRPSKVTFKVYNGTTVVDTITLSETNWTGTSKALPKKNNGQDITYTVREDPVPAGYTESDTVRDSDGKYTITNSHTPGMTTVYVKKIWNDEDNADKIRPANIKVNVKNGETVVDTITLSAENGWADTSKELPAKNGGIAISYEVEEVEVPDGYTMTKTGSQSTGFTITNSHTVEKYVEFDVEKTWVDKNDEDAKRPTKVTVRVFKNGEEIDSKEITEATNWKAHFKYAFESEDDVYTIKEDPIDLYQTKVEGDVEKGFKITNTYIDQAKTGIINLSINKYEEGTTNTLSNAKFKITIKNSDNLVEYTNTVKTNKNGNVYIPGIELKLDTDYVLEVEETEAPAGYEKSKKVIKANFKLTKERDKITISMTNDSSNLKLDGNEFVLKFENKKMTPPEVIPQTGSSSIPIIVTCGIILFLLSKIRIKKGKRK